MSSSHDLYITIISVSLLQGIVANRNCVLLGKRNDEYKLHNYYKAAPWFIFPIFIGKLTILQHYIYNHVVHFNILYILISLQLYTLSTPIFLSFLWRISRYQSSSSSRVTIQVRRGLQINENIRYIVCFTLTT